LSVETPNGLQHVMELGHEFFSDQGHELIGHDYNKFTPFIATLFFFILFGNLLGLVPGFESPTKDAVVPLGLAVLAFVYYNVNGLLKHGPIGYFKHFLGPVWWLAPLMFPVEIISTSARLLSLTVRLWANIFASDLLYVIFLGLLVGPSTWGWSKAPVLGVALGIFPALIPIAFIGLHIFVAIIQTYVFALLPAIYIGIATADEH
jgi:F-type H+-transporting ATPase subunit a